MEQRKNRGTDYRGRGNMGYIPKEWIEEIRRRGKQRGMEKGEIERDIQRINVRILETGQKLLREDIKQAIQEAKSVGVNMRAIGREDSKKPNIDPSEDTLDRVKPNPGSKHQILLHGGIKPWANAQEVTQTREQTNKQKNNRREIIFDFRGCWASLWWNS
jgi:hypothetical protein